MAAEQEPVAAGSVATKPDSALVLVWWFWLAPALMELPAPIRYFHAVYARGRESVAETGIGDSGFAIVSFTALLTLYGLVPFVFLSALYVFLFSRSRARGMKPSARFWIPVYGAALIASAVVLMVIMSSSAKREHMPPNGWASEIVSDHEPSPEN